MQNISRIFFAASLVTAGALVALEPFRAAARETAAPPSRAEPGYEDRFRDYVPYTGMSDTLHLWSPTRDAAGIQIMPGVSSKWQQPRRVGTTPHQGVDLLATMGTPVHPIDRGWIVYQAEGAPSTGRYELIINLDWNWDGIQNDDVYVKYDHLQYVFFRATGSYVYPQYQVATSGNEGGTQPTHLHFGVLYPKFDGSLTGRWNGVERLYAHVPDWNYGRDLDFISYLEVHGSDIWVNAYRMSGDTHYVLPAGNVHLFHRPAGYTPWDSAQMAASTESDWYVSLRSLGYAPGQNVEWLVRARVDLTNTTETHNSGFFPPQFRHPHNNPNETATRFPFYTTQVQ